MSLLSAQYPALRLIFLLLLAVGGAAHPLSAQSDYQLMQFSLREGLRQSQVTAIAEDGQGNLYVGTQGGGVNRFDGQQFHAIPIAENTRERFFPRLLYHAGMGKMLALSGAGNLYAIENDSLHRFTHQLHAAENTARNQLYRLSYWRQHAYALTSSGELFVLDSTGWQARQPLALAEKTYVSFFGERNGSLLVATSTGKLYDFREAAWQEKPVSLDKAIYDVQPVPQGLLLASAAGIFFWNKDADALNKISEQPGHYLALQADQGLWVGTMRGARFLQFDDNYQLISEEQALTLETGSLYKDAQEVIWIGTMGGGLFRATHNFWQLTEKQGLAQGVVMALSQDMQGRAWVGFQNLGIQVIAQDSIRAHLNLARMAADGDPNKNVILNLSPHPAGGMWVATGTGLAHVHPDLQQLSWFESSLFPLFRPMSMAYDADSNLWVGHRQGILLITAQGEEREVFLPDTTASYAVWDLIYDSARKQMLAGTSRGTFRLNARSQGSLLGPEVGLSLVPYGNFWLVGSELGLSVYDTRDSLVSSIDQHTGMLSDFVYSVTVDDEQTIWLGTARGLTRLCLDGKGQAQQLLTYTEQQGFLALESNHNANYFDGKRIWLGTVDGLYRFDPTELPLPRLKPYFTAIRTNYDKKLIGTFAIKQAAATTENDPEVKAIVPSSHNHLTFHFQASDRNFTDQIQYSYQLEGLEEQFSQPVSQRQVAFASLAPGDYTFRLRAILPSGTFEEITYPFRVEAPFYRKPAFIALLILLLLMGAYLIFRYRTRQQVAAAMYRQQLREQTMNRIRAEIARDFHDEMGNKLVRIINYSSMLRYHANDNPQDILDKVEGAAKQLYQGTRDFIWSLNPENDSLNGLAVYLTDFGNKLFEEKNIRFYTDLPGGPDISLPAGYSRDLVLILKEGMTNIFKHAEAGCVWLRLRKSGNELYWMLEDDGKGMAVPPGQSGRGLRNMQLRAKRCKGSLEIKKREPRGTCLLITLSLHSHEVV